MNTATKASFAAGTAASRLGVRPRESARGLRRPPESHAALVGARLDNLTLAEVIARIDRLLDEGGSHQVAVAGLDLLTHALHSRELCDLLHRAELVVAGSMPLVWASRLIGSPLREPVAGPALVGGLLRLSARRGRRIFLLGATEEDSRAAAERARRDYPGVILCGRLSPPAAALEEMDHAAILERIHEAGTEILVVALGTPRAERWIARNRHLLNVPVAVGVGRSIDLLPGRAPRPRRGMERPGPDPGQGQGPGPSRGQGWIPFVHRSRGSHSGHSGQSGYSIGRGSRIPGDPRRLAGRLYHGIAFLHRLSAQLTADLGQGSRGGPSSVTIDRHRLAQVATIHGSFDGPAAADLFEYGRTCDAPLIIDLRSASRITSGAFGVLVDFGVSYLRAGRRLCLVSGESPLRAAIRATFPGGAPFATWTALEDALEAATMPVLTIRGPEPTHGDR